MVVVVVAAGAAEGSVAVAVAVAAGHAQASVAGVAGGTPVLVVAAVPSRTWAAAVARGPIPARTIHLHSAIRPAVVLRDPTLVPVEIARRRCPETRELEIVPIFPAVAVTTFLAVAIAPICLVVVD